MIGLETCLGRGCCRFGTIPPITTHCSQTTANAEVELRLKMHRDSAGYVLASLAARIQRCGWPHWRQEDRTTSPRSQCPPAFSADVQRLSTSGIPRPSQNGFFSSDRRIYLPCGRTLDGSFTLEPRSEKRVTTG